MSGPSGFRQQSVRTAIAAGLLFASTGLVSAQSAPPVPPTEPIAKAAYDVLDKHCARCHQDGKLVSRERPAKNFGNVLKLEEIGANPHHILPGNPLGSKLFKQIVDKEMPYDIQYEGETKYPNVSEADLKALETWITSLGANQQASCESHKFIDPTAMVGYMAADIEKVQRARRENTRYLTLTHLANICVSAEAMKVYRQGAIKFINSMSQSSDIVRLEAIDPEETILRINLTDLGWSAADWDKVLAVYPYNVEPDVQLTSVLSGATKTPLPYVRADWLTFTAAQPPLYDDLLKLPLTFQGLAKEQGVNLEANIRNFVAQRAAFQKSGVSQNNRLIERHPSKSGYFWTSYDFGGNRGVQSLFEHPLGPEGKDAFHHDGGETIFSLPNGFQGYYLNTAKGERLDKGPTIIVRDMSRKDLAVTNGISCMGCHDQGMRKAKDEIRDHVTRGRSFSREVRETVDGLYPPAAKMDALIEGDGKRFTDAMIRAGLTPTLKLNGVEMINALSKRYEDDVDLNLAAAEFGIDAKEFKSSSGDVDQKLRPLVRRLEQGAIPRDQFEQVFRDLAEDLTDLKLVEIKAAAAPKKKLAAAKRVDDLSLTSDKDDYRQGESPVFTIVSPRDCFLTLTNIDEKGEGTVLLPNKFQQDNRIKANVPIEFPGKGAPFQYKMKDKGTETVTAVCAAKADGGDKIQHDFTRSAFTQVPNYRQTLARSISVVAANPDGTSAVDGTTNTGAPAAGGPKTPPKDDSRASARAAIKLEVR